MNRFFIAGCQRSGTTLLRLMLESHPRICCYDEQRSYTALRDNTCDDTAGNDLAGYKIPRWTEQLNAERLEDEGHGIASDRFYQGEPILFLIRDARAVVSSMMQLGIMDSNWWRHWGARTLKSKAESAAFRQRYGRELKTVGNIDSNPFAAAALYWKYKTEAYFDYLALKWPILAMRYEDLVQAPETALRSALDVLGAEWDENVLRHDRHSHADVGPGGMAAGKTNPKRAVDAASLEQWKHLLSPQQVEAIESVAGDLNRRMLEGAVSHRASR